MDLWDPDSSKELGPFLQKWVFILEIRHIQGNQHEKCFNIFSRIKLCT